MRKTLEKRKSAIVVILLILIFVGFISHNLFANTHDGFDIQIKNNTNENINGLVVTYNGIDQDIELPEIQAGKAHELNINPKEDFSENSMIIYYKDKRGYTQKNTLIGYFEKGYKGKVKVNINSKDKNGLIIMQVQENIR